MGWKGLVLLLKVSSRKNVVPAEWEGNGGKEGKPSDNGSVKDVVIVRALRS